jgi:hypothetical protein
MKLERSNVEFPIWRKKVDKSLFHYNGTTIPEWACGMWGLPDLYAKVSSKSDPKAQATAEYNGRSYSAWVTAARHGRKSPAFRFWYDPALSLELKRAFLMSYMRTLEGELHKDGDAEKTIPFWEFLDVEFDNKNRKFILRSYFTQTPSFPNLFARLVGSPALNKVEDELEDKGSGRIYKQDWKTRDEIEFEIGAQNVIYTLIDTDAKLVYIGEAADLVKRLMQPHQSIPHWNWFRYNVLPSELSHYRVAIERMIIRDFAALCPNKRGCNWRDIGGYSLANDKVDK